MRFANFAGRSLETIPGPSFEEILYGIYKKGVLEPVPDSLPQSLRTSLSSVLFAGTSPDRGVISERL